MLRFLLLILSVVFAVAACGGSTQDELGVDLYNIVCSGCHGPKGEGTNLAPALVSERARSLTDDQISGAIRVGPGAMPGNPSLTESQLNSLVIFIRDLQLVSN